MVFLPLGRLLKVPATPRLRLSCPLCLVKLWTQLPGLCAEGMCGRLALFPSTCVVAASFDAFLAELYGKGGVSTWPLLGISVR